MILSFKKLTSVFLSLSIMLCLFVFTGCGKAEPSSVYDKNGKKIAVISSLTQGKAEYEKSEYAFYVDFVLQDAVNALSVALEVSVEKAEKFILKNGYKIETLFDDESFNALLNAGTNNELKKGALFGGAVTDLSGGVTAIYSSGQKEDITNFAIAKSQPYSSIKPLSVYTPALKQGIINWSTVFMDEPFKKINDKNGQATDWPTNSNGIYTSKNITVANAVKDSVNTISIACLDRLTVDKSLEFLKNSFDLKLEPERQKASSNGAEEIYGNLGMGYLLEGVSPLDMAGYYSIFANGGSYTKPYAVTKITNKEGDVVYQSKPSAHEVIDEKTAYIMNRMLNTVVTKGGTGSAAMIDGVDICGKTGTGSVDDLKGNWFVGFTPKYSCAIWHGGTEDTNNAADIFKIFANGMDNSVKKYFVRPKDITQLIYCEKSGKRVSSGCSSIASGYFDTNNIPDICEGHN